MDTGDGIQGTNMYVYCHNNPIAFYDPSGTKIQLLSIPGGKGSMKILFATLQDLTDDVLTYDKKGIVSISEMSKSVSRPIGTQLVRDAIASDHLIRVMKFNNTLQTSRVPTGDSSLIIMDYRQIQIMRGNDAGLKNHIALGHELIHAMHAISDGSLDKTMLSYIGLDGIARQDNFEELRTVGLLDRLTGPLGIIYNMQFSLFGFPKRTENGLRAENGLPLRQFYSNRY